MHNQHIVNWDTKFLSDNLCKCRLLALYMGRRASVDHHGATLLDTHTRAFIKSNRRRPFGSEPTDLDIGGYADAHQLTLGTLSSLFGTQALVIRDLQGFVQGKFIVAGIINCPSSRLVWELLWLDEVDSTYLYRVLAQFTRHQVHDSLYYVGRLGSSGSTIGICRSLIREDGVGAKVKVPDIISTTRHREPKGNHDHIGENLGICTKVRYSIYLQTCHFAIPGRRSLHIVDLVASMDRRCQSLAAVLNPLDGMAQLHSSVSSHKLSGVDIELRAKANTHFGYNHTHLVLGKAN